ncbi:hypothetical protein VCRA2113O118_50156 [Vibrio crassostreae]|nr:hypothetical protein VCRA2114E121_60091 [Vibrio crassostreae]CAK3003147.1 hypothetical protein VCRA2113O118_50156 [Vibrio crassostreae]
MMRSCHVTLVIVLIPAVSAERFLSHLLTDIVLSDVKSVLNRGDLKPKYDIMCHIEQEINCVLNLLYYSRWLFCKRFGATQFD